jgi:diacylglycerol kinase (CTP)
MALGTDRETATNAHDINGQQRKPRRRSRLTRSPSLSRSSTNGHSQRSPSSVITFHPTPLSPDNTKGVKNITRKVIKRLEGLGHLEMVDFDLAVSEEDEDPVEWGRNGAVEGEESEVEEVLYALGREAVKSSQPKETRIGNGTTEHKSPKLKPDLEIPRKMLHASIGPFSSLMLITYSTDFSMKASILYTFMYRRAMCALSFSCYGWHWLSSYQLTFSGSNHQSSNVGTKVA